MAAENDVFVDSGSYTPASQTLKRRLAEQMLKNGTDTSPITSPWQGLARIAQAMLGGYQAYKLEQNELADKKALVDFNAGKYGGSSADTPSAPTPAASSTPGQPGATPASNAPADKIKFGRQIAQFYIDQGYTPTQAAAIAGNMVWEGGGRTDLVNPGDNWKNSPNAPHSVGIAQWNDRSRNLIDYARKNGIDIPDGDMRDQRYMQEVIKRIPLETQLGFSVEEMKGPEARAAAMLKAAPDDLRMATRGAISYHRPAGWGWSNPEAGHGFAGRLGFAGQILNDLKANPYQRPVQQAQFVPEDQNDPALTTPAAPVQQPPVPAAQVPAAAPPPVPGQPPQAPAAAAVPPSAPQMPAAAPQSPAQARPPLTQAEIYDQAFASMGPRGELVRQSLRSVRDPVRKAAEAELAAAVARIQAAQPPIDPLKQADLAKKQAETEDKRAVIPKHQAEARKANADAAVAENNAEKLRDRNRLSADIAAGLSNTIRSIDEYGQSNVERAIGPYSGTDVAQSIPGAGSNPAVALLNVGPSLARLAGNVDYWMRGGVSPETIRKNLRGDMNSVAANIKDLVRQKGEGAWSDKDQQMMNEIVGDVTTSSTAAEAKDAIKKARDRIRANWGLDIPELQEGAARASREPTPGTGNEASDARADISANQQAIYQRVDELVRSGQPLTPDQQALVNKYRPPNSPEASLSPAAKLILQRVEQTNPNMTAEQRQQVIQRLVAGTFQQ